MCTYFMLLTECVLVMLLIFICGGSIFRIFGSQCCDHCMDISLDTGVGSCQNVMLLDHEWGEQGPSVGVGVGCNWKQSQGGGVVLWLFTSWFGSI